MSIDWRQENITMFDFCPLLAISIAGVPFRSLRLPMLKPRQYQQFAHPPFFMGAVQNHETPFVNWGYCRWEIRTPEILLGDDALSVVPLTDISHKTAL